MGIIRKSPKVKLFSGILTSLPDIVPEVQQHLSVAFGAVDLLSRPYAFDQTHYYDEEMGSPITRYFLSFEMLILPWEIASIKKTTNELEAALAGEYTEVRRPVNLDPGYVEESKIVLASTKNFYHRIQLTDGIYGEVTLHFSGGAWRAFPWSFPDFRSGLYDDFFTQVRRIYRDQIREAAGKSEGSSG